MPAAHTLAFLPAPADIPPGVDVDTILADLADDGVSAPADDVSGLQDVVARAHEHGIDLRIVVLAENPGRDSQLRDIATDVGVHDGGTVLALSPTTVATTATAPSAGSRIVEPRLARAATKPPRNAPAASRRYTASWLGSFSTPTASVPVNIPPPTRK